MTDRWATHELLDRLYAEWQSIEAQDFGAWLIERFGLGSAEDEPSRDHLSRAAGPPTDPSIGPITRETS